IGLAASALRRAAPNGALFRLFAPLERGIREELRAELFALGQTYEAAASHSSIASAGASPRVRPEPARTRGSRAARGGARRSGRGNGTGFLANLFARTRWALLAE